MASRSLVAGPTSDPVSLAEAKAHCRIDTDADDGLLAGYILAARQHLERYTNRAFVTQTWRVTLDDGWPRGLRGPRIELPFVPLQSVEEISYVDADGTTQTLAANLYQVVTPDEFLGYVVPAYGASWPTPRRQPDAVTVRCIVGHSAARPFPEPLRQAILLLVGHWYEHREAVTAGQTPTTVPLAFDALVAAYRVHWL